MADPNAAIPATVRIATLRPAGWHISSAPQTKNPKQKIFYFQKIS
jgi:hypothetical protein